MKMISNTAVRCEHGCCRSMPQSRRRERRLLKRSERQRWRSEARAEVRA